MPALASNPLTKVAGCLGCARPPCVEACPLHVPIPLIIRKLGESIEDAWFIMTDAVCLPELTAILCPSLRLCEGACVRARMGTPTRIPEIKLRLAAIANRLGLGLPSPSAELPYKVAVVGSGPAGLAAAFRLRRLGCEVTVFEKLKHPGGTPASLIPDFRLPRHVLRRELARLEKLGIEFVCGVEVGSDVKPEDLAKEFDGIVLAVGCSRPRRLRIPGEELRGVFDAYSFLRLVHYEGRKPDVGERVIVIGGGDTAIDAARTAVRLGASEVIISYRRGPREMPAYPPARAEAEREGVRFLWHTVPLCIVGDRGVRGVMLADAKPAPRGSPVEPIPGTERLVRADSVIVAIGREPSLPGWASHLMRALKGRVFVAGDAAHGESLVAKAMASGDAAARELLRALTRSAR